VLYVPDGLLGTVRDRYGARTLATAAANRFRDRDRAAETGGGDES